MKNVLSFLSEAASRGILDIVAIARRQEFDVDTLYDLAKEFLLKRVEPINSRSFFLVPGAQLGAAPERDRVDEDIDVGALSVAYHSSQRKMVAVASMVLAGTIKENDLRKAYLAPQDVYSDEEAPEAGDELVAGHRPRVSGAGPSRRTTPW